MARRLTPLGHARVYRNPHTGELIVDTDSLRRASFAGEDFGDDGYDDFEGDDDEFGDEDDPSWAAFDGDDEFGDDDEFEGDDDDDEFEGDGDFEPDVDFGRRRKRGRRRGGRRGRRSGRRGRKQGKRSSRRKTAVKVVKREKEWGMTAVSGSQTLTGAGSATVRIRLQHDFKAQDITFEGSASGATVTSIFFGDQSVFSNPDGIPVNVFASNSFLRGLLKGQTLKAGLDIVVNGTLSGQGTFSATIVGAKPK